VVISEQILVSWIRGRFLRFMAIALKNVHLMVRYVEENWNLVVSSLTLLILEYMTYDIVKVKKTRSG